MAKTLTSRSIALLVILVSLGIYYLVTSGLLSSAGGAGAELLGLKSGSGSTAPLTARDASKFRTASPLKALVWNKSWESDPFYYAEAETTDALGGGILGALFGTMEGGERPSLVLAGISWNGNVGMALINGDIFEEGDRVAGYQISKIAFDHVILRKGTSIVKVNLDD